MLGRSGPSPGGGGGGGGSVDSVTGLNTDNTDPANPVVRVSVDGSTITGAGTPASPLVASGGTSLPTLTNGQIWQRQGGSTVATFKILDSAGNDAIDWSNVGEVKFLPAVKIGPNTNGRSSKLFVEVDSVEPFITETSSSRQFWSAIVNGSVDGAGEFAGDFGFYATDFFGSGEASEIILNGPISGYKFRVGGGGERNESGNTYFNHLGNLFFGDTSRPSITPSADAAVVVGKELTAQNFIEFFLIDPQTPQILVTFNNSLDSRAARIEFLEDASGVTTGSRVGGLNLGVDDDAEVGIYSLGQIMTKVGSYGTIFTDGANTNVMLVNVAGKFTFYNSGIFQTTVGSVGSASALPALPREYLQVTTPSGDGIIPVYNVI